MDKYGSTSGCTRFGNPPIELTDYFKNTPFRVFQALYVGAVFSRVARPRLAVSSTADWAKQRGAKGPCLCGVRRERRTQGPCRQEPVRRGTQRSQKEAVGAEDGDAVFFAAGRRTSSQELLGAVRVELARRAGLLKPDDFAFTWVVDFSPSSRPMTRTTTMWQSAARGPHASPFTMPSKD